MLQALIASIALDRGQTSEAAVRIAEALRHARAHGNRLTETDALLAAARIGAATGRRGDAAVLLAAWHCAAQSIGLAGAADDVNAEQKLRAGLHEVLSAEEMDAAWEQGCAMGTAAAVELACSLASSSAAVHPAVAGATPGLSRREHELLKLLAEGAADAQIAERLVHQRQHGPLHLDRIRDKTGARRRVHRQIDDGSAHRLSELSTEGPNPGGPVEKRGGSAPDVRVATEGRDEMPSGVRLTKKGQRNPWGTQLPATSVDDTRADRSHLEPTMWKTIRRLAALTAAAIVATTMSVAGGNPANAACVAPRIPISVPSFTRATPCAPASSCAHRAGSSACTCRATAIWSSTTPPVSRCGTRRHPTG